MLKTNLPVCVFFVLISDGVSDRGTDYQFVREYYGVYLRKKETGNDMFTFPCADTIPVLNQV